MENKYYIPEIEELCVGFEYEKAIIDCNWTINGWKKDVIKIDDNLEKIEEYRFFYRVRYLDEEDIIESVFKFKEEDCFGQRIFKYKSFELTFYPPSPTFIEIDNSEKPFTKFIGRIKNKTEFKKLLKQLEIDGTN